MAYNMAMNSEVANTMGSENMRKGRMRATDKVFLKLCLFDTRGARLADLPSQDLAARVCRLCSTGPYVSKRVSELLQTEYEGLNLPGKNNRGINDTPANRKATQYFRLQLAGETKPAMIGPLAGPILRT